MLYAGIGNKIVHVNPARAITVMSVREDFVHPPPTPICSKYSRSLFELK